MGRGMGGWGLVLCVLAGCSRGPSFVWDAPEGAPMAAFGTVALDPRTDLVWASEGRRPVNAGALPEQALKVIQAKGYAAAPGMEAGLWLDVILMTTEKGRGGAPSAARGGMRGGMRGGGGMRGSGMDGGMRGGGMEGGRTGMGRGREEGPRPEGMERGAHVGGGLRGPLRLAVQVLSRIDGKLVWYGAAELPEAKEGVQRQAQLEEALRTLLEKVPPAH